MKHVWSIGKLLKNANALPVGTGKSKTTLLYSETKKHENFFDEKNTIKMESTTSNQL